MTHQQLEMRGLTDQEIESISGGGAGQLVAQENHESGIDGASGNPKSSAGPGFFFEPQGGPQAVSNAVHSVMGK